MATSRQNMVKVVNAKGRQTDYHQAFWDRQIRQHGRDKHGYVNGWREVDGAHAKAEGPEIKGNIPPQLKVTGGTKNEDAAPATKSHSKLDIDLEVESRTKELREKISDLETEKEITKEEMEKLNQSASVLSAENERLKKLLDDSGIDSHPSDESEGENFEAPEESKADEAPKADDKKPAKKDAPKSDKKK